MAARVAGAVYSPPDVMVPRQGPPLLTFVQVKVPPVPGFPATVNCCVPPGRTIGRNGAITGLLPLPAAAIVMLDAISAVCPVESVKPIVNVVVSASFGIQLMLPDEGFRLRPEGSEPSTVQE